MQEKGWRFEPFCFEKKEPFQVYRITESQKLLHCHDCLEVNLIEAGSGQYLIGDKSYKFKAGDLFVINNAEYHIALWEEKITMLVIVFPADYLLREEEGKELLKPFLGRGASFSNRIGAESETYGRILEAIMGLEEEGRKQEAGWRKVSEAWGNLLLSYLYRHYAGQTSQLGEVGSGIPGERIYTIFRYVEEHFQEEFSLEELAKQLAVHKNYLCRYFKKVTGMTIFTYLEQVRIQYACYLLAGKGCSVTEAALESGFGSVSFFGRVFKRYKGVSPGQYMKKEPACL